ncbi:MAG: two-component system sensor histidine kinase NtrB [Acidobacteriota bacterium]
MPSPVPTDQPEARLPMPPPPDRFFRHMVANMRNGVLAWDRAGRLVLVNEEARRIFRLPPGDFLGQPYAETLRSFPDLVRALNGTFEMAALPNRAETALNALDVRIGYTLSVVRDDRGQAVGGALFFKDLTHVEQMEERERLRDRLAVLGEMAASMAHEIKNPLAGIEVMAGLLRRQMPDPQSQSLLNDILGESRMANAIVQEMLDFVRPVRLQVERASVLEALESAIVLADGKARRGQIAVELLVSPTLPFIQGDLHQLVQVFSNLLINAYEALDGLGTVTITARLVHRIEHGALAIEDGSGEPTVLIEFADSGPGIAPELTDKIFNPFVTTKAQGSGLGLAVVRKIVDAHEGRIDVTSAPGRGTCFRVTLPVRSGALAGI